MIESHPLKDPGPENPLRLEESPGPASNVMQFQIGLSGAAAAAEGLLDSVLGAHGLLAPGQKRALVWALVSAQRDPYYAAAFATESNELQTVQPSILQFALKLSRHGPWISSQDIDLVASGGINHDSIIEIVATVACAHFLGTLSNAIQSDSDSNQVIETACNPEIEAPLEYAAPIGPFIPYPPSDQDKLKNPYSILGAQLGFLPNLFRIQGYAPDILTAQVDVLNAVLFSEDHLSRVQKEQAMLRIAAVTCNTYLAALHSQVLGLLGTPADECDQIIADPTRARIPTEDKVLLEEAAKLSMVSLRQQNLFSRACLRKHGFSEPQIDEAIITAATANFLSIMQFGLGPEPDFPPRQTLDPKHLYLSASDGRPNNIGRIDDPDLESVVRVKNGETEIFADLVRRHSRRIFGVLLGIVGSSEDARDLVQDVFLKAFQGIENFQGRSKFSTWLTSIAVNTGTEALRRRRPMESIDESEDEQGFRPRQLESWVDDPEQQVAKSQMNELVRRSVMRLPETYRMAVLLRDIKQLPTEEVAEVLGLGLPAVKARILRGRLMLRESLAPHFARPTGERNV